MEDILKKLVPISFLHKLLQVWLWLDRRERCSAVGYVFYNDEILVIKKSYGSRGWTFPGGFIKRHEDPKSGLCREVGEEVGLELEDVVELGTRKGVRHRHVSVHCFYARSLSKQCIIDELEVRRALWVPSKELDAYGVAKDKTLTQALEYHQAYGKD